MGMGSPAPAQGMTDEQIAALLNQVKQNQAADPSLAAPMPTNVAPPVQMPAVPLPNVSPSPAPAPAPGGISGFLQSLFGSLLGGTSAKELAAPEQGGALTPEELQRRRRQMTGQP